MEFNFTVGFLLRSAIPLQRRHKSAANLVAATVASLFVFAVMATSTCAASRTSKVTLSELSGQIFIVTRSRANIKLALVGVTAIPEKEAVAWLRAAQAKSEDRKAFILENVRERKSELAEAERNAGFSQKEVDDRLRTTKEYLDSLEDYEYFSSGPYYFETRPVSRFEGKSDADGRFRLLLPEGRYALTASASRMVGQKTEGYYWLIWIDVRGHQSVTLSNDNLFGTGCAECVRPETLK